MMTQRPEGILRLPSFANRPGPARPGQPDGRALAELLSGLGQLRSSAELDRAILDGVHRDLTRSPRAEPALLLVVALAFVAFFALVKFQPGETVSGPRHEQSARTEAKALLATVEVPAAPVHLAARIADTQGPAIGQAKKPLTDRPLATYHPKGKSALALREPATSLPQPMTTQGVTPRQLVAVTPLAVVATAMGASQLSAIGADREGLLTAMGMPAGRPPVPPTHSLSWAGTDLATAPIKLHERVSGMVRPSALLASLPPARHGSHRPIYKRAWFVGMLGVAATGLAAGVTAAVVSSQPAPHGTAGQPIRISLGPT